MQWNAETVTWAVVALLLFAAEAMAPGAFMLWLGFAAAAVFLVVLVVPGVPVLAQVAAFVVLSFVSIQVYRVWFRGREPGSDQPALNRRAQALVGRVVPLELRHRQRPRTRADRRCVLGRDGTRIAGRNRRAHRRQPRHESAGRACGMRRRGHAHGCGTCRLVHGRGRVRRRTGADRQGGAAVSRTE